MKYSFRSLLGLFFVASALTFGSCADDDANALDYEAFEQELLDEWIKVNAPDLVDNRQSEGYFIDITQESTTSSIIIKDVVGSNEECWIAYKLTGYDLENNVVITRSDVIAWQQGTYTRQTRYAPIYLSVKKDGYLPPFLYDALTSTLNIDGEKRALKIGDKIKVYTPSTLIGFAASPSAGYYGQTMLSSGHPMVAEIEIVSLSSDADASEVGLIEKFANNNGTLNESTDEEDKTYTDEEIEKSNVKKESVQGEWSNALDNIPNLYINRKYVPTDILKFNPQYTSALPALYTPYYLTDGVSNLESRLVAALESFMADKEFSVDTSMAGERIGKDQQASIWYICRTLDGFIVDTNIDEVGEMVLGKDLPYINIALKYKADNDSEDMIKAWYYAIPQLRYGQWAAILTDSAYAYPDGEAAGSTDSGSTTEIAQYTPLLFQIYIEPTDY